MDEKVKETHGKQCDVCNTYIPNDASMSAHITGKKHQKNLERVENWKSIAEKSLYVTGIKSCAAAELELADYFSQYGAVSKITVDKNAGHYALVEFCDKSSANNALKQKDHRLSSTKLIVKPRDVKVPTAKKEAARKDGYILHDPMPTELWNVMLNSDSTQDQFFDLQKTIALSSEESHLRTLICQLLESALSEVFPDCEIQPFGSSVNGFGISGCDLDINFCYTSINFEEAHLFLSQAEDTHPEKNFEDSGEFELSLKQVHVVVASIIKQCIPDCHKVKPILTARRPVVRFVHAVSHMCCDLSVGNTLAVRNSLYLKQLSTHDPYLVPLVLAVRTWMKHWKLSGSQQAAGTQLNNYAVTLLVLYYLVNCKPQRHATLDELRASDKKLKSCCIEHWDCSLPEMSCLVNASDDRPLPEIFAGFFQFYAKFEFDKFVLCLKSGKSQDMDDLKATALEKKDAEGKRVFKFGSLNIFDPFELNHNVAGNVGKKHMLTFVRCIRNAALASQMKIYFKAHREMPDVGVLPKKPWGILNLFVDHHKKKRSNSTSSANRDQPESIYAFEIKKSDVIDSIAKAEHLSDWCEDTACLLVTILSDVYLMNVDTYVEQEGEKEPAENPTAHEEKPVAEDENRIVVSTHKKCSLDDSGYKGDDTIEENASKASSSKKRSYPSSPTYCKRARLALSSPEALDLKERSKTAKLHYPVTFPFMVRCKVMFQVWEGRRKARRLLVQTGKNDVIDLERQVSKLLVSELTSAKAHQDSASLNVSSCSTSSGDSNPAVMFSFDLTMSKIEESTLSLNFRPSFDDQQSFRTFFHHFQTFVPALVLKCEKMS